MSFSCSALLIHELLQGNFVVSETGGVAASTDGKKLAFAALGGLYLYDLESGSLTTLLDTAQDAGTASISVSMLSGAAFAQDNSQIVFYPCRTGHNPRQWSVLQSRARALLRRPAPRQRRYRRGTACPPVREAFHSRHRRSSGACRQTGRDRRCRKKGTVHADCLRLEQKPRVYWRDCSPKPQEPGNPPCRRRTRPG